MLVYIACYKGSRSVMDSGATEHELLVYSDVRGLQFVMDLGFT